MDWMRLSIICTVCGCEMNEKNQRYLILNSKRKHLVKAFSDTLKSYIDLHHLKHKTCSGGSFRANYPKESVQSDKN